MLTNPSEITQIEIVQIEAPRPKSFFHTILDRLYPKKLDPKARGRTSEFGGAVIKAHTKLTAVHLRDGVPIDQREILDRVVTNAGRDAMVDAFTNTFDLSTFNYHDCGEGSAAENVTDTALGTPAGTARQAGTQSQPTSDKYRSVATISFSGTKAITEHGLFSASSGGTLLDRTVFAAINVISGDAIQFTFEISFAAGG